MTCTEIFHQLDAFVDGELAPEEMMAIRRHLDGCAACRARADELRALTSAVQDGLKCDQAPSDLWARIEAELPADTEGPSVIRVSNWWREKVRPLALAASVVLLFGIATGVTWWQFRSDDAVIAAPVQDFTTYRLSGRTLDVESSNPEVINAWFEEKLAFELPRVKARVAGFDLVGGRLCGFLDRRISALAYQRGEQVIAVYIMADHDLSLPEATFEPRLSISRSVHEVDDVRNMIWHDRGLVYSVVSNLGTSDLSIFLAALARGERESARTLPHFLENHEATLMGASA